MKYQGREFRTYLQAPTERELSQMIRGIRTYAKEIGAGPIKVVQKGRDPDGGWEAMVVAHNWNPIKWIKRKIEERKPEVKAEHEAEKELLEEEKKRLKKAQKEAEEKAYLEEKQAELRKKYATPEEKKAEELAKGVEEEARKAKKEERKAQKAEARVTAGEAKAAEELRELREAQIREAKRKAGEDVWGRTERTAGRVAKVGKAFTKVGRGVSIKPEYIPKASPELYTGGTSPMKTTGADYEYLREQAKFHPRPATSLSPLAKASTAFSAAGQQGVSPLAREATAVRPPVRSTGQSPLVKRLTAAPVVGSMGPSGQSPLVKLTEHPVGRVRGMGPSPLATTGVGQTHGLISSKGEGAAMALLREMGMPRGLSMMEKAAFAEIRDNNDRDTLQHISSELAGLGIARKDAEKAVGNLLRKGLVEEVVERKGERPIYEVAR